MRPCLNAQTQNLTQPQSQTLTMNIILIEDDPRIADFLQRGLKAEGLQV